VRTSNRSLFKRILGDKAGATILEFALILPVFSVGLIGTFDLGYSAYLRAMTNGVLQKAARRAAVGNVSTNDTTAYIRAQLQTILPVSSRNNTAAVTIKTKNYYNFSNIEKPERITGDTAPVGTYNSTDCYEDRNGNGSYDLTNDGEDGVGSAEDVVYYEVKVSVPRLFPMDKVLNWDANQQAVASTIIRNQPFAAQEVIVRCT
jgi:Flp pilus assembly protein TadG